MSLGEFILLYDGSLKVRFLGALFIVSLLPIGFGMAWLLLSSLRLSTFSPRVISTVCIVFFYAFGVGTLGMIFAAPFVYEDIPEYLVAGPAGLGWTWGTFVVLQKFKGLLSEDRGKVDVNLA